MAARNVVIGQRVSLEKVQRAKELRREQTPEERALWQQVRRNELAGLHFRRQQVIDGFIVDFYCHAAAIVVEIDGGVHDDNQAYDQARDQVLAARGLRVLRITNDQINRDLAGVLKTIAEACQECT